VVFSNVGIRENVYIKNCLNKVYSNNLYVKIDIFAYRNKLRTSLKYERFGGDFWRDF